ncbi:MAG: T9SS type A sorting domain-containing protein, partial [Bacteroidota bacterium]
LWANDFDAGSNDYCTSAEDIRLTFADPTLYPDSTGRTFRCTDGEVGTVQVFLWAQDLQGNTSFCETFVTIQANGTCGGVGGANATIGGDIMTTQDEPLESVEMTLSGDAGEMAEMMGDGAYSFTQIELGYDYTITPYKNDNPLNGVSTFDLVLMNRHVLGTRTIEDPYLLIAGDVNNSGNVSTFDIVLLRKLILNIDSAFTRNTSWRFIPASFEFPEPANPWASAFPEVLNINDFEAEELEADFVAVKIGDVNGSATGANNLQSTEGRNALTKKPLQIQQQTTATGYQLDFYAPDLAELEGFQFALTFDPTAAQWAGLEAGILEESNLGWTKAEQGEVYVSWNAEQAGFEQITTTAKLFSLYFEGENTAYKTVEQWIQLDDKQLSAEAYGQNGNVFGLEAVWLDASNTASTNLHQNTPNPFAEQTTISFELSKASQAILEVRDITGKLFHVKTDNFTAGKHQLHLPASILPKAGVYYYSLQTADYKATKKMVLIK